MKHFILDSKPNFGESCVQVNGSQFKLKNVEGRGCYFVEYYKGVPVDQTALTPSAMKALYLLLTTE